MEIKKFTFNPFQENTFVIWDDTKECIIIDPGCYEISEEKQLVNFVNHKKLIPKILINTHCHIDHILGNEFVSKEWNLDLHLNQLEIPLLESSDKIADTYGFYNYKKYNRKKKLLNQGDKISFGKSTLEILFTPGHSPGHISLLNKDQKIVISGDVLFNGSIGRTDLPGGDFDTLINSIKTKLFLLNDDTLVLCGHGPSTTISKEKNTNPFLI